MKKELFDAYKIVFRFVVVVLAVVVPVFVAVAVVEHLVKQHAP